MKKLIAKTRLGTEYLHSKTDCFYASKDAVRISNILNQNKYKIKDDEIWYVYDLDYSQESYVIKTIYISKSGKVTVKTI